LNSAVGPSQEAGSGREEGGRTGATFTELGEGRFELGGELSFHTAGAALEESKGLFSGHEAIEIDLAGITRADSAGLALLLEWVNWAHSNDRRLRFRNLPAQILCIAEISEVEDMLPTGT
jgi:phospholipid transport system transporter-binding protein